MSVSRQAQRILDQRARGALLVRDRPTLPQLTGMTLAVILVSLLALTFSVEIAAADKQSPRTASKPRYSMLAGRGWSVCESYLRTLNASPPDEGPPLCNLRLDRVTGVSEPEAEELDIAENLPLVHKIELALGPTKTEPTPASDFAVWRQQFEPRMRSADKPRLRRLQIPLTPGGNVETLLIYDPNIQGFSRASCSSQIRNKQYVDFLGSRLLLFDVSRDKVLAHNLGMFFYFPHELRLFNGRLYAFSLSVASDLDGHSRDVLAAGRIRVHQFQFAGKMPDHGRHDSEYDYYGRRDICLIRFDNPFAK